MQFIVALSQEPELLDRVRRAAPPDSSLCAMSSPEEAASLLRSAQAAALLLDLDTIGSAACRRLAEMARRRGATAIIVATRSEPGDAGDLLLDADERLQLPASREDVAYVLERALRRRAGGQRRLQPPLPIPMEAWPMPALESHRLEEVLREFARVLSAGFDLDRLLELFLDSVQDLVHATRLSVLLARGPDNGYRVRASRGLRPELADSIHFPADRGLPLWLATEARICRREEIEAALASPASDSHAAELQSVADGLAALQALVSLPLMSRGRLVGLLNVGPRATGAPYAPAELDILFSLGSHVAVACEDIQLHHQLAHQHEYTDLILAHMSCGLITIDPGGRITTLNPRAGAILDRSPDSLLGQDLRRLPSPLGDMLHEAMTADAAYDRHEVTIHAPKLALEVSTYRLCGPEGEVLGSAMILEDVSARRELEAAREHTGQLDLLNKLVGRLAHEINNPLVAIRTFAELLPDRYDDAEFRRGFQQTVLRELDRIEQLVAKLVGLTHTGEGDRQPTDLASVVEASTTAALREAALPNRRAIVRRPDHLPEVRADPELLGRAIGYVVRYLLGQLPEDGTLVASLSAQGDGPASEVVVTISAPLARGVDLDPERLFDPLAAVEGEDIAFGLPVTHRIVEEHGGRITVEPGKDNGTVSFVIAVPARGGRS